MRSTYSAKLNSLPIVILGNNEFIVLFVNPPQSTLYIDNSISRVLQKVLKY